MAEKDPEDGANLELPSLFGRRKKRQSKTPSAEGPVGRSATDTKEAAPLSAAKTASDTVSDTASDTASDIRGDTSRQDDTEVIARPEPTPPSPAVVSKPVAAPVEPPSAPRPRPAGEAEPAVEPAPTAQAPRSAATGPSARPERGKRAATVPVGERVQRSLPDLAANTAAVVVGALVGLIGCVLTYVALKGCEVVTGADSCGGPGLLILIAIVVAMVLIGAALLRMFQVPEAGNLSFLGVGIMATVTLVVFIDYLFEAWMFVAIPVLTALCYGIARWVTTRWTDDGDDDFVPHDVR